MEKQKEKIDNLKTTLEVVKATMASSSNINEVKLEMMEMMSALKSEISSTNAKLDVLIQ